MHVVRVAFSSFLFPLAITCNVREANAKGYFKNTEKNTIKILPFAAGVPVRLVSGFNDVTLELLQGEAFQTFFKVLTEAKQGNLSLHHVVAQKIERVICALYN